MVNRNLIPDFIHTQMQNGRYSGRFQAAALFVDIAGFTRLTETLAQFHRDGAEALTAILHHTFSPHVREVYNRGGIIPLFAGDSFIAIFPEENEHDPAVDLQFAIKQALQTAFTIQRFFQEAGVVETPYGNFEIGVKIGLSVGHVQWGIPGTPSQHAFYFRGNAIDGCAQAQQRAEIGGIVADKPFLITVEELVTAVPLPEHNYHHLIECRINSLAARRPLPDFTFEDLSAFIPETILHMTSEAEFREVAPVFISFQAPNNVEQFHTFIDKVLSLARQYGGYFSQIDFGDKGGIFVILFGAPIAYENQVERAVEFLHSMKRQNFTQKWRAGMTFGVVWAGIRGSVEQCEYGAVGDMVNLAARLAMKADWGKIWVSESVNTRLKQKYWLGALGEFPVKGKQKNVPIYQLFHKKEASQDAFYNGEFIGRESELAQLYEYLAPIFNGRFAGITYVHGETGIGKSRLVHEFRRRLMGKHYPSTFYCQSEEIIRTSLNPFKSFLRAYFRQTAEKDREDNFKSFNSVFDYFLQQIPGSHPEGSEIKQELRRTRSILAAMVDIYWSGSLYEKLEPKLRFENTLAAFKNFIKAAALSRPVIIHIENGHWLDSDSRRMLTWLTRNVNNYPIAIICVNRFHDNGRIITCEVDNDVPQHHIELGKMDNQAIRQMATQILNHQITDEAVAFLAQKSDGNPFFLEQLILDLYERGMFVKKENNEYGLKPVNEEDIPANINTLLLSRLDRLENEIKHVVRTATVLGQEFELRILSHMLSGDPNLINKVQVAEEKQVWKEKDNLHYLFQSTLLRDAAYSMQLRSRLRKLHHRAAEGIEQLFVDDLPPYYSDLAYHYDKAEMNEHATHWYQQAGKLAADKYANDEALTHYTRALSITPLSDKETRYELLLLREAIYALTGNHEQQKKDLDQIKLIANELEDDFNQIETSLRYALYAEAIGDYKTAVSQAHNTALLAHHKGDLRCEAMSHLCWGRALLRQGQYEAAKFQFQQALRQASDQLPNIAADSQRNLGVISVDLGQFDTARTYYQDALAIYQKLQNQTGTTTTLNNLGVLYWNQGDYQEARKYYQEALNLYRHMGHRKGEGMVLNNLGTLLMAYGDYNNAQTYNHSALFIVKETGIKLGQCFACLNLGLTHLFQNAHADALQYSQFALQIAKEMGAVRFQGYALLNIGHALYEQNQLQGAEDAYRKALSVWHEMEQANLAVESRAGIAAVTLRAGNLAEAQKQVEVIMRYLDQGNSLAGTEGPFNIYLTCYEVLTAVSDPRADNILHTAFQQLQEKAMRIQDKETRHAFLNNVRIHQKIIQLSQNGASHQTGYNPMGQLY